MLLSPLTTVGSLDRSHTQLTTNEISFHILPSSSTMCETDEVSMLPLTLHVYLSLSLLFTQSFRYLLFLPPDLPRVNKAGAPQLRHDRTDVRDHHHHHSHLIPTDC